MSKFAIGQRVKISKNVEADPDYSDEILAYIGAEGRVTEIRLLPDTQDTQEVLYGIHVPGNEVVDEYYFTEEELEEIT